MRLPLVEPLELLERGVERQHIAGHRRHAPDFVVQGDTKAMVRTLDRQPPAGVIDQHATHHAGGDRQEVSAALPIDPLLIDQPQVGFVNQGGRLQRVVTPFAPQAGRRPGPEIPMHEREQVVPRLNVAASPGLQQEGPGAGVGTRHVVISAGLCRREAGQVKPVEARHS